MIFNLLIILFLYGLVFLLADLLYKKGVSKYITRKIVHIGGGLVSLLLPIFFNVLTAVFIGLFFFLFFIIYKRKKILETVYLKSKGDYGVALFPLGLTLSFVLFVPINIIIFQGSVLILALSDGFAGLLGNKLGNKKYQVTGEKTWLGSLFFFVITLIVLLCLVYFVKGYLSYNIILLSIVASLILTFVEGVLGKGFDNLFLPPISGLVLYYLLIFL